MTDWSHTATLAMFSAQDEVSVPGAPGASDAQPGTTLQPGGTAEGGSPQAKPGGMGGNLFFIVAIGGMFIFMLFMSGRAQRAERKKKQAMLNAMGKHDKVQTIGGIIGTVSEIRDDEIVVKVDESTNTKMTFAKSAVQQVIRPSGSLNNSGSDITNEPELASAIDS
jgi:preprotein translocase subunit YajC